MRLFTALDLPPSHKDLVSRAYEPLRPRFDVRWVRAEGLHLTLVFLGETADAELPRVTRALDEVAARHPPFSLSLRGAGTFGSKKAPRVLWLGVEGDLAVGGALQADLEQALGAKKEHDSWSPHLTLGRSRSPRGDAVLLEAAEALKPFVTPPFACDALTLFETRGGRYVERHRAALGR